MNEYEEITGEIIYYSQNRTDGDGDGDHAFIITKNEDGKIQFYINDFGGKKEVFEELINKLDEYTEKYGAENISAVLEASHFHDDHVGGFNKCSKELRKQDIRIENALLPANLINHLKYTDILKNIKNIESITYSENESEALEKLSWAYIYFKNDKENLGLLKTIAKNNGFDFEEIVKNADDFIEEIKEEIKDKVKEDTKRKSLTKKEIEKYDKFFDDFLDFFIKTSKENIEVIDTTERKMFNGVRIERTSHNDLPWLLISRYAENNKLLKALCLDKDYELNLNKQKLSPIEDFNNMKALICIGNKNYLEHTLKYTDLQENMVAYRLIRKLRSGEENQLSVCSRISDDKLAIELTGDSELPSHISTYLSDEKVYPCDCCKMPHHTRGTTSGLFILKVVCDSLAEGKFPYFINSRSKNTRNESNEKEASLETVCNYLGIKCFETYDGSNVLKKINGEYYIEHNSLKKEYDARIQACISEFLKTTDLEENKKIDILLKMSQHKELDYPELESQAFYKEYNKMIEVGENTLPYKDAVEVPKRLLEDRIFEITKVLLKDELQDISFRENFEKIENEFNNEDKFSGREKVSMILGETFLNLFKDEDKWRENFKENIGQYAKEVELSKQDLKEFETLKAQAKEENKIIKEELEKMDNYDKIKDAILKDERITLNFAKNETEKKLIKEYNENIKIQHASSLFEKEKILEKEDRRDPRVSPCD